MELRKLTRNTILTSNNYGYSRLKRIFTSNFKYRNYEKIADKAKNKIIGNIPDEILKEALKTNDKEATIKQIQNGFAQVANELNKFYKEKANHANQALKPDKEDVIKTYEKIIDGDWEWRDFLKERIKNSIYTKEEIEYIQNVAEDILKKSMEKILPPNSNIKVKRLGEGNFATTYKIEFRDNKDKKIFNDYVIKVYKDVKDHIEINKETDNKIEEILYNLSDAEIKELYKNCPVYKNGTDDVWKRIVKEFREKHKPKNEKELSETKKKEIAISLGLAYKTNGINAEANTYSFIRKACGHPLDRTNLNKHYMFDLENKFNISNYSDGSLPSKTSAVNYSNIGIIPFDAYDNFRNIVYGRIIDVGGMAKISEDFMDKTVRKYFKKIMNRKNPQEREIVIKNLETLVKNPKTPLRNKIQKAIELAKAELNIKN